MMELIQKIGFLPLLDSGIEGFSAEDIVDEDFIYPRDKHNREYGWGWSLLNTPEDLYGREAFANATALPRNLIRGFSSI